MQPDNMTVGATTVGRIVLAAAAITAQAGCTSPLTTVALREFLRESTMTLAVDSDAEEASKPDDDKKKKSGDAEPDAGPVDDGRDGEGDGPAIENDPGAVSVEQRIERSLERLARSTAFDPVARDVLVDTLEKAAPEDWPAIIDSFSASLEASPPRPSPSGSGTAAGNGEAAPRKVAGPAGGLTSPVTESIAAARTADDAAATHEEKPEEERHETIEEPRESPQQIVAMLKERLAEARRNAPLVVRRACFASKVRGWGDLDAFDEPRFMPGQDVLVYLELDNLDGIETTRGFSTRVEASLRLLDAAGGVVGTWSFPLVEDRADSPRTDYFVRYLVRIPADATAGSHRLEAAITDAVSSKTVTSELAVEVVSEDGGNRR